jgi:3-oxoacyl-[acyl-carrier protein] reductase
MPSQSSPAPRAASVPQRRRRWPTMAGAWRSSTAVARTPRPRWPTRSPTPAAAGLDAVFEQAEALGPVLGLVNNAGVRADNLALSISDDEWDLVIETNLSAAFRLTRRAMRSMLRARFGRIVNVASVVGPRANPGQANYAASKAGLIGMTKTVAAEVARKGVTVNSVAPGFIATDMTKDLSPQVLEAVPARRAGSPEEVAACVRFLASDAAAYVTGTTLYVDGGMSA